MGDCLFPKTCAGNKIQNQGMVTNVACNNLISRFERRWQNTQRPFSTRFVAALQNLFDLICSHVCVISVILFLALIKTFQLILHKGLFVWYRNEFRSRVKFVLYSLYERELKQRWRRVAKTSPKKRIRALLNFIALIPTLSFVKWLRYFQEMNSKAIISG